MTHRTERRRARRARPQVDLRMTFPGISAPADVRDVSSSGVCCTTDRPMPVLSQVHLLFLLPSSVGPREVSCNGAVVRCVKDGRSRGPGPIYETAIFFTNLRETDRAALEEFVTTLRGADQVA
jgi:hypothetical protein